MNKSPSKILVLLIIFPIFLFAMMFYSKNRQEKASVESDLEKLRLQLTGQQQKINEQETSLNKARIELKEELESQQKKSIERENQLSKEILSKQVEINRLKEDEVNQELENIKEVVSGLKEQTETEKKQREANQLLSKNALKATHIASGLHMASGLKTYIVEYYLTNDRFPSKNRDLGLPKPRSYATDSIQSLWISKGGKISVIYNEKSGMKNGSMSLTPKVKNEMIEWRCESKDFKFNHEAMPNCRYTGR